MHEKRLGEEIDSSRERNEACHQADKHVHHKYEDQTARLAAAAHRSSDAAAHAQSPVALEQRSQLLAIDADGFRSVGHLAYELSARANSSARANKFSVAVSLLKTCSSDFWPVCSSSCVTVPSATIAPS